MGLHTEDGLHVVGGGGVLRTFHAEHGGPFGHRYTGGELAAGKGDGVVVSLDGFLNFPKRAAVLILDVAVACHIHNVEHACLFSKNFMLFQQFIQGRGFLHAGQQPECMAEMFSEHFVGEGILAGVGFFYQLAEEGLHGGFVHKLVLLHVPQLFLVGLSLVGVCLAADEPLQLLLVLCCPHTEELMKLERLIVLDSLVADHLVELEGEYLHAGQVGVGVGIAVVLVVPLLLGGLLHHVVPGVNLALLVLVGQVEGGAGE